MTATSGPQRIDTLIESIRARSARIGVIGLGYVGLPLVLLFEEAGFPVTGFDVDTTKTGMLNAGETYIRLPMQPGDVPSTMADVSELESAVGFRPSTTIRDGIARFVDWYRAYYGIDR